jgi:hypothetical protein
VTVVSHQQHAVLATTLLRLAERVLAAVPRDEARPALDSVRAFAAEPAPHRYLTAVRILRAVERQHKMAALGRALGAQRAEQGLESLARAGVAPQLLDALRALPPDARNGRRLAAISDLIETYRLINVRAAAARRALFRTVGASKTTRRALGPRRPRPA